MKTLCGTARQIRQGAEVAGNQHGFGTSHVVTFRLDSRAVQLSTSRMPDIAEGDVVAVVGDIVNGTLVGRAYRNLSAGTYDRVERRSLLFIIFYYASMSILLAFPCHFFLALPGNNAGIPVQYAYGIYAVVVILFVMRAILCELKSRWAYCCVRWGQFRLPTARA